MKAPLKSRVKKQKTKKKPLTKDKKAHVAVITQEFRFAWMLSGNEKRIRDKVLKTLKKWLQTCFDKGYEFKEDDFIRLWKGLFYGVWMSDKPLVQEELCENIAGILDLFPAEKLQYAVMMTKAGLKVLATQWYGIDQHRLDKFLMLVRRYIRGSLRCLQRCDWSVDSCQAYTKMLMSTDGILCIKIPQYAKNAVSMILHVIDCFLEELAKVSNGTITEESLAVLLQPFTCLVCAGEELAVCVAARRLLTALLRQSAPGLRYQEATRAWQKMGCPAGGPEALELVSDDEGETEPTGDDDIMDDPPSALDPRAGRVNVYLPLLPVPARLLADQLKQLMAKASSKAYKRAKICLERFEALAKDKYPLVIPEIDASGVESPVQLDDPVAAGKLHALEKQLIAQSDELALRGLKRKHRKRLLAKTRAGHSIIEDVAKLTDKPTNSTTGEWQIEDTGPDLNEKKEDSNKKNEVIKKKTDRKRKAKENAKQKVKKVKKVENSEKKNNINNKVSDKSKNNNIKTVDKQTDSSKKVSLVNGDSKKTSSIDKHTDKKVSLMNGNSKKAKKASGDTKQKIVKNAPKLIETDKKESLNKNKKQELTITEISKTQVLSNKVSKKAELVKNKSSKVEKKVQRQKVLPMSKIKNYQKQTSPNDKKDLNTPKKVKFVLKNNSMQGTMDYFKSVKQSPNIPFDSSKKPSKTNLKPSTPSPINPFFKKKLKMKF